MCMSISNSGKSEMQDWLTSRGIQYPESALKGELLLLTSNKNFILDVGMEKEEK